MDVGIIERLFGRAAPGAATSATAPAGVPLQVPYLTSSTAAGLSAVWRSVTLIADLCARMPWQEWRGDELLEPSRLVRKPAVTMPRREWTWRVIATEALYSTAYLLHTGGTDSQGAPWSLLPIPPGAITPHGQRDAWGMLPPDHYNLAGTVIPASWVTVVRRAPWPGVSDELAGVLNLARRQFQAYLAADTAANRYWMAGGPTTAVLSTDQELTPPQADQLREEWVRQRALGGERPIVLGKGADAKPWGADPTAEGADASRWQIVADVGRYFGVPTRILNAPAGDSETYSNVELDGIDLYRYTLAGYIDPLEDAISELLPGDALLGRRLRLDPSHLYQGPLAERATAWVALTSGDRPIATVAEARVKGFGLPPVPETTGDGEDATQPAQAAGITVNAQVQ